MRKYIAGFILGVGLVLGVVSCAPSAEAIDPNHGNNNPGMYRDTWHKMPDGRTVYCLYIEGQLGGYSSGKTPSFECDFASAKVHP